MGMLFELIQDLRRWRSDGKINSQIVKRNVLGERLPIYAKSESLKVG